MVYWRPQREVFILVASSTIAIVVIILACCYRVLKKWMKGYNEDVRSNPKSRITENSELGPPVQVCQDMTRKANINEGYLLDIGDIPVEDNGMKIFSAENVKDDGQFLHQPDYNQEGLNRLTRVNHDGSMDTRF